jgi:hypothetical protein
MKQTFLSRKTKLPSFPVEVAIETSPHAPHDVGAKVTYFHNFYIPYLFN